MWPVPARSSPRPDSVRLSSNDNGSERVIKHRNDVPQASISHVPQRFTEVCCGGGHTLHVLLAAFLFRFQHMKNHSASLSALSNTSTTDMLPILPHVLLLGFSLSFEPSRPLTSRCSLFSEKYCHLREILSHKKNEYRCVSTACYI